MVSTRDTGAAGAPPASPKAAAAPPVNSPAAASPRGRARGPSTRGTGHGGGEFASPSPPPVSTRGTGPPVASPPPVPVDDRLRARSEADGAAAAAAAAAERARKLQREKGGAEAAEVARVEAAARAQCDADAAATVRYVARATPAPSTFRAKVLRGPPPLLWVVAGLALLVAVLLGALLHTRDGGSRLSQLAIEASRGAVRSDRAVTAAARREAAAARRTQAAADKEAAAAARAAADKARAAKEADDKRASEAAKAAKIAKAATDERSRAKAAAAAAAAKAAKAKEDAKEQAKKKAKEAEEHAIAVGQMQQLPPWATGAAKGAQATWLQKLGMHKAVDALAERKRQVAGAEVKRAASAAAAAAAAATAASAEEAARVANERMVAADRKGDFKAAAKHNTEVVAKSAVATKERAAAETARRNDEGFAAAVATTREALASYEMHVAVTEGALANKEVFMLQMRMVKLAGNIRATRRLKMFSQAHEHKESLAKARAQKAALLKRYTTLTDMGDVDVADEAAITAAEESFDIMVDEMLARASSGEEGKIAAPASHDRDHWLRYLGMGDELAQLTQRRKDLGGDSVALASASKDFETFSRSAKAARAEAQKATDDMRRAVANNNPEEAAKHQEKVRARSAEADAAEAAAAVAASKHDAAASAVAEGTASLRAFEASMAKQELLVARLQARVLAATIRLAEESYDAAMRSEVFHAAAEHKKSVASGKGELAALLKVYGFVEADLFGKPRAALSE